MSQKRPRKRVSVDAEFVLQAQMVVMLLNTQNTEDTSHDELTLEKLLDMLLEDVVLMYRRPGSWEGSNMAQVLRAHGYNLV